ncbi:MAG: porin [Myxococcales bacterium]
MLTAPAAAQTPPEAGTAEPSAPSAGPESAAPVAPLVAPAPVAETLSVPQPTDVTAPAPGPVVLPPVPAAPSADQPYARLDYSDGVFYLRSIDDNLVFVPGARMHLDTYTFQGPGVASYQRANGTGLKTNLFFRRFIIEFGGLIRKKWFYYLGGNFAPTQVDGNQAPLSTANVYDGFVGYLPAPTQRIYLGQYNAPFTMENVTSSRWLDMMERALIVRTVATPYNKAEGLMWWGNTESKSIEYQLGIFGGDGMNRPNIDNRFDGMGRVVLRPFTSRKDALAKLHIGGGARYGSRDPKFVRYAAPGLSTPGGYTFWSSTYGKGDQETWIVPSARAYALAGEFYIPFERFDVRGEVVYANEGRREVLASAKDDTLRSGTFKGVGGYLQLSMWLLGTPRINGNPAGVYGITKLPDGLGAQAKHALQLVARGELFRMHYDSDSRSGVSHGSLDAQTSNIFVNVYQVGLNYWATKHVRLTAEYSLYQFPGTPTTNMAGADNQAAAPGAKAGSAPKANSLNEFSFRVGLAL